MNKILIQNSFGITELVKSLEDEEHGTNTIPIEKGPNTQVQESTADVQRATSIRSEHAIEAGSKGFITQKVA
jgi:hypothetical protein